MACGQSAIAFTTTTTTTSFAASILKNTPLSVSSISTPSPSRLTKRKNYLRPKLLKTLKKPYPNPFLPELPSKTPKITTDETIEQELKESELDEFSHSQKSSTVGFVDGLSGNFSTGSVFKIGLYLVGAFVFQTICAVLIFGSTDSDYKDGNWGNDDKARVLKLSVDGRNKETSKLLVNGNEQGGFVFVDEPEMGKKIVEIQEMAREARRREKLESKRNVLEEEDDDDDDFVVKSGIEKEVDDRLVKLQKSLSNSYDRLPYDFLRGEGKVGDEVDKGNLSTKEAFGPLMFKKKYRFKSPSVDSSDKPKGFEGNQDHTVTMVESNEVNLLDKDEQIDLSSGDVLENVTKVPSENGDRKETQAEEIKPIQGPRSKDVSKSARAKPVVAETKSSAEHIGIPQETRNERPALRTAKSGKSSKPQAQKPRGFGKEDATAISNNHNNLNKNGSLKGKRVGNRKSANKLVDRKSYSETDFWWSSLPFVLAILMQRGNDGEGPEGLFTLRNISHTNGDSTHTVAFEDRGDATNFCYLLESFFEDLDDFSANIVPIPTNELDEAVKLQTMKVLVVRKGQLQLYAGQPLTDVEMAMRTLVGQNDVP